MEPCYFDGRCTMGGDPFGGLGCNAGGHASCRFCGFGNYLQIPCPTGGTGAKQVTVVLSGTMDDVGGYGSYKRMAWESSFKEDLAALIGLHKSRIKVLDCREASVLVEVLLMPPPSTPSSDPTLSLPADAAVERLIAAIAAGAAAETPPPALGGMQVMLASERLAPPAPPFTPSAQLMSSYNLESLVSPLTGAQRDDSSTMGVVGAGIVFNLLLICVLRYRFLHRRRRLREVESHKSEIHEVDEELEQVLDVITEEPKATPALADAPPLPTPPPLDEGHALPTASPSGEGNMLPKYQWAKASQQYLPKAAMLPAPGSAFEDDFVPQARPTVSRPTKRASVASLMAAAAAEDNEDVAHHPALAMLGQALAKKRAVAKEELLMREKVEDNSRLRKIVKEGTPIRVLQQRKGSDGEMRGLITHDPPAADRKGKIVGWVIMSQVELLEGQPEPGMTTRDDDPPSRSMIGATARSVIGADEVSEEKLDDDDEHVFMSLPAGYRPPKSISHAVIGVVGDEDTFEDVEQTYITRITLKMRAEADMKSAPAGEMPANAHVHVREWRTLPEGTRRAHVCEVGSSPEKSGWLSCVSKDGAETLLPTTARADEEHIFLALPRKQAAAGDSGPSTARSASTSRSSSSARSSSTTASSPAPAAPPLEAVAPLPTPLPATDGLRGIARYQLIMREGIENNSRLRKVIKNGTAVRVLQQATASDGGMRALITHDPPITDFKGNVEGWVMWSDKGENFIELIDDQPDAVVRGADQTAADSHSPKAAAPMPSRRTVPRGTSTHHLRTDAGVGADIMDGFDANFGFSAFGDIAAAADAHDGQEKLAARFARGARRQDTDAVILDDFGSSSEFIDELTYTTRITLKMRAEADMKSAPAGEMPANAHVHVREWRTLPEGTRRAHVCEVGSSPEKSGWLSCVSKDGAETLLPTSPRDVPVGGQPTLSERTTSSRSSGKSSGRGEGDAREGRVRI